MPTRPPKPCAWPACPWLTRDRYCPMHAAAYADRERARLAARPSASQRGYGREWQRARGEHIAREPYCRECAKQGVTTAATEVDHIVAMVDGGTHDPANLQSLCGRCHRSKTQRQAAARRRAAIGVA